MEFLAREAPGASPQWYPAKYNKRTLMFTDSDGTAVYCVGVDTPDRESAIAALQGLRISRSRATFCILNAIQFATLCHKPSSETLWVIAREILKSSTPEYVFEASLGETGLVATPESAKDFLKSLEGLATPLPVSGAYSSFEFCPISSAGGNGDVRGEEVASDGTSSVTTGRTSSCGSECSMHGCAAPVLSNATIA